MRISDWSSDVCSSDLLAKRLTEGAELCGIRSAEARHGIRQQLRRAQDRGWCLTRGLVAKRDVTERARAAIGPGKAALVDGDVLTPGPVLLGGGADKRDRSNAGSLKRQQFLFADLAVAVLVLPDLERSPFFIGTRKLAVIVAVERRQEIGRAHV